ncbi:hypothetical protein TcBrA4_0052670 [Trypanosoma cruzi]|nr:hypothetical protein TcBrA4_0052670 [Trypanosoma cruzi]
MAATHFRRYGDGSSLREVIEIPGKNSALFGMLMNLLRGYRNPIPEAYREVCLAEARFYGLEHSWESRYPVAATGPFARSFAAIGFSRMLCAPRRVRFTPAGFTSSLLGYHAVRRWGGGWGGGCMPELDGWHGPVRRLGLYWNDGRVTHNFGGLFTEKTGCSFTSNALIKVELDCEENIVRWSLSGEQSVAVVRLPPKTSFAFAAVLVGPSEVRILRGE